MAEGTIKNRIVIEGEAEYKKALAEINRALKESKSELKAVAAEYAASGNSAKGLTAQIATLEKTHAQQSEQLQLMQEHLTKVTAAYGENSREAVDLRTKINNARAEMAKTSGELTQLRTRLDAAGDAMDDLASGAGGAEKGLERIGDEADSAQDRVGDLGDELGGLGDLVPDLKGKLAGALTIGAIGKGIGEAFSLANDELVAWQNLAAYTGETGDNLERLKDTSRTVYQAGYGDSLMEVTTSVAQIYQQTGMMDDDLAHCVETALTLSRVFGMDVGESTRAVSALMQNFGIDAETAYDLIVTGAQNGADKNGNLLDTINEYSPYFAQSGKGADEFFAALIEGAQAGVYDVDKIGDAWKEFMLRVTSGEDGPKDALKELGFAATDVTKKIAAGGPAADLATQQIVQALYSVEDPFKRNQLGVALFGTQWEDTGGRCLEVFANMEQGLGDVTGAGETLNKVTMSDFDTALEGTKRRIHALIAEFVSPTAQQAAYLLSGFNALLDGKGEEGFWQAAAIDSGVQDQNVAERQQLMETYGLSEGEAFLAQIRGGDVDAALAYRDQVTFPERAKKAVTGWFTTLETAREGMGRIAADGFTALQEHIRGFAVDAADAIGSAYEQIASAGSEQSAAISEAFFGGAEADTDEEAAGETAQRWVDVLRGNVESKAAEQEQSTALGGMLAGMLPDDTVLTDAAKTFAGSHKAAIVGQMTEVYGQEDDEDFKAWQDFQTAMIESAADESLVAAMELGEDEAQETIDAISSSSPAARRMGEYFGGEIVSGTEDGAEGMYDAGASAAQGAIDGARSGEDAMYNAGKALGGAFRRGFQEEMQIHSPSRAAMEDMAYVTEGYLTQAERDRSRIAGGAAALADALREGFGRPELAMPELAGGDGGGLSAGALAQAIREELSGMAVMLDGERVGTLTEVYSSRATSDRVAGTVRGQSSLSKNW